MFYECLYVYNFSYLTLEEGILCTLTFSSIIVQIPCEQNELIVILGLFFLSLVSPNQTIQDYLLRREL